MNGLGDRVAQITTSPGFFPTTHWSVVLVAGEQNTPASAAALESLCQTYWYPLYAYVRHQGYSAADAQDLTQGFFQHILSRSFLNRANPDRGKFRSFVLRALKFFLADELAKLQAQKRGGGKTFIFLDALSAEERYRTEPSDTLDAEKLFERRWAITLLHQVIQRLEAEFTDSGRAEVFAELGKYLLGDRGDSTYQEAAQKLNTTEGAIKAAVHRMRQRYRELFREEVAQTVADPAETEDEMRHVFAAICS